MIPPDAYSTLSTSPLRAARRWAGDRRVRATGYALAILVFAGGIGVAWSSAEISVGTIGLVPALAVALLGVPLQVLFGGLLLRAIGELGGRPPGLPRICRVVGLGTLSSVLPVSSGTVVRGAALVLWGMPSLKMLKLVALDALLWTALALALSGVALLSGGGAAYGLGCLAGAALIGVPTLVGASILMGDVTWRIVGWRVGGVLVDVARLWACFAALSRPVTFEAATALAAAAPLSSLLFFLPGGLGVRELATAGLAYAASVDPAVAFLAASLNRLLGYAALGAAELLLAARVALPTARGASSADDDA